MEQQFNKYFSGELGTEEKKELLSFVDEDKEAGRIFRKLKNIYALTALTDMSGDEKEAERSYRDFMKYKRSKKAFYMMQQISRYAAVAILCVGLTYWFTRENVREEEADMLSFYVPAGQRMQMTLQDGTDVWLNAGTTLKCPSSFTGNKRQVEIDGEAFFEVKKDVQRPFIVSSNGLDVQVLGTKFNVNSYSAANYYCTSLLEGSVKVYYPGNEQNGIILKPDEQLSLIDGKFHLSAIKDPGYFLWTEGIYSFNNEPLENIFKRLELYFDIQIVVTDPSIYEWEYTGKFRQSDGIDGILHIINKYHKFKIKKDDEKNVIVLS